MSQRPPRKEREIGNPGQPLSSYIMVRSTTPDMGPGWLVPKRPERRVSASHFSAIPRFASPKPMERVEKVPRTTMLLGNFNGRKDSPLHFSRRESRKKKKTNNYSNIYYDNTLSSNK